LIDLAGEVVEERRGPRPDPPDVDHVVAWIAEFVRDVSGSPKFEPSRLVGLGVATPAILDEGLERVIRSTNLNWRDVPLAQTLRETLGMAVYLENNVGAIALGERWFGAGQDAQHLACLNIGLGVSMGLIVNGMLHRGVSVYSGQIGHTIVDPEGLPCPCGRRGCLDTVAGGQAIRREMIAAIQAGRPSAVLAAAGGDCQQITVDMIAQAADQGDPLSCEIVRAAATRVGYALSNAVVLLDPDTIILSGSLIHSSRLTTDTVVGIVRQTALASPACAKELRIVRAARGELAAALGAASIVHQRRMGLYDAVRVVHRSSM
jgi:predicted NBD/HSP70 family sugar kinase